MCLQLRHVIKNTLDQATRSRRVVQSDLVGDRIKVLERRLRPNQLSHRAIRFLAAA